MKTTAILEAALDLFEDRGYGATPVPQVADRAGVAVGTIYRYFPGKEGLANALYRHWKQAFADAVFAAFDTQLAGRAAFDSIWAALADFAVANPAAFAFLETHSHSAYLDAESRALTAAIDARLFDVIRAWQAAGVVRGGDPAVLLAQVFGGFVGVVRHLRSSGRAVPHEIGALTRDAAWAALSAVQPMEETI
jgi:TetR/AcrR family transcriptional regulator, repressor of fatR-cypB operon